MHDESLATTLTPSHFSRHAEQCLVRPQRDLALGSRIRRTSGVVASDPPLHMRRSRQLPLNLLPREVQHRHKRLVLAAALVRENLVVPVFGVQQVEVAVDQRAFVLLALFQAALPELQDGERVFVVVLALGGGVDGFVVVVDAHPGLGAWVTEAGVGGLGGPLHGCAGVVAGFALHYFAGESELFFVVGVGSFHLWVIVVNGLCTTVLGVSVLLR